MSHHVHEDSIEKEQCADRWSKDLIGTEQIPTTNGFCLGVADYSRSEFGEIQIHDDQEALYVVSGVGEVMIGETVHQVRPGNALYVPPKTKHATRRTADAPVKVIYTHGAV